MSEKYLTAKEIAEKLKLSQRQVAERVTKRPDFPAEYRIGRLRRWLETEVSQWIQQRKVTCD